MGNEPLGSERVTNTRQDKIMPHVDCVNCLYIFHGNKAGADLWGAEAAAAPPFSLSEVFFLSKYTIILSFCKRAVGTFDFFS